MLAHRLRRWPNNKPTLAQRLVLAVKHVNLFISNHDYSRLKFTLLGDHSLIFTDIENETCF